MRFALLVTVLAAVAVASWPTESPARPSGEIAFTSYEGAMERGFEGEEQGSIDLWRDGKTTPLLEPGMGETFDGPVWSPDGATIAAGYSTNAQFGSPPEVALVDRTGIREGLSVAEPPWFDAQANGPGASFVSPDGHWDAYAVGDKLFVHRHGAAKAFVVARCPKRCASPAWRPARRG